MLENFNSTSDEAKRQLYVAMTRAKQHLAVHLNANFLDSLSVENLERIEDRESYQPPKELVMHLGYKDVWLDYFANKQQLIAQLMSGSELTWNGDECLNQKGQSVLKFSKHFLKQMESLKEKNYILRSVNVNFILYWLKEGADQGVKIVLPELHFEKQQHEESMRDASNIA